MDKGGGTEEECKIHCYTFYDIYAGFFGTTFSSRLHCQSYTVKKNLLNFSNSVCDKPYAIHRNRERGVRTRSSDVTIIQKIIFS